MNLTEWKIKALEEERNKIKQSYRNGEILETTLLSEEQIQEIKQEVEIEQFCEVVDFDEEFEIDNELLENVEDLQDYYEFIPESTGQKMDLELEFDLTEYDLNYIQLGKMRDLMFAEDYDVEVDEDKKRAKVVFKRAGGQIRKRKKCGPGMRLKGNRCIPQTGTQKAKFRRTGIKLKRVKRALGAGKKKRAALKARITKRRVKGRARNYANT